MNRRHALATLSALLLTRAPLVQAFEAFEVLGIRLEPAVDGESWVLSADFLIELPAALEEAVNRGITLVFVIDFELVRPRLWWWDQKIVETSRTVRLNYSSLARQYRVQSEGLNASFVSLPEALEALSQLRGWRVFEQDRIVAGQSYEASVRLRLDGSFLPKPLQLSTFNDRDWNLQSPWKQLPLTRPTAKSAP